MKASWILLTLFILASCTQKQEIAQWRGENRDGSFNETGLLKSWPEAGPDLLWAYEGIGDGYGSVAVTSDKIFVNGEIDSISHLFAFGLDGVLIWKASNGKAFMGDGFSGSFPGSRSTPTIVDDLVYVSSGHGRIACFDVANGEEKWTVDMQKDLGGLIDYFGYGESLLVEEDKVFCFPGGKEANFVALNRFSGEIIWKSEALADTIAHCSPMLVELPDRKIVVTFSIHDLMGIDAETGELLWSHKQQKRKYSEMSNTPIYYEDYLYYVTGDGNGAVKLKISEDGSSITEVWSNYIGRNSFYGFVISNDKLYCTTDKNKLLALELQTGITTDSLKVKLGGLISADNMLYCYTNTGEVQLIDPSTKKMETKGSFKIDKGTKHHFARPVIKNGVLYIRHGDAMMAYNLKEE